MKTLGSIVLLLAVACLASADDGYTSVGNGIYKYGNGSSYYKRHYVPPCYTCGYRTTPGYWVYQQVDYTPPAAVPSVESKDFESEVIGYLENESKQAYRADVLKGLIARLPPKAQHAYALSGQTTTYYGQVHAYQPVQAQLINPNDALQQYGRIVENAQTLGREAAQSFGGIASQVTTESTKAAQIQAALHGAAQVVRATQESKVQTTQFQVQSGPEQPVKQFAPGNAWNVSAQRCASCHSGAKREGGFDVAAFPTMDADAKLRVFRRLITNDAAKRMPRAADGSAGQLPAGELSLWMPSLDVMAPAK